MLSSEIAPVCDALCQAVMDLPASIGFDYYFVSEADPLLGPRSHI
jgi:hypothetical protein